MWTLRSNARVRRECDAWTRCDRRQWNDDRRLRWLSVDRKPSLRMCTHRHRRCWQHAAQRRDSFLLLVRVCEDFGYMVFDGSVSWRAKQRRIGTAVATKIVLPILEWLPMFRLSGSALPLSGSVAVLVPPVPLPERCVNCKLYCNFRLYTTFSGKSRSYLAANLDKDDDANGNEDESYDNAEQSAQQGGQFDKDGSRRSYRKQRYLFYSIVFHVKIVFVFA